MAGARWPTIVAIALLAVAWFGFWLYAHPGYMSFDSAWQLREARAGVYSDWHPPIMAAIWRQLDRVISGPFGMLLVQSGCFVAGVWLMLRRRMSPIVAAVATLVLLWLPPISATLAVIWKDSQMLGFAALGCALLESPRRGVRLAGLALLALATAMRINAFTITLPIVVGLFTWQPAHTGWRRWLIAAGAWLLITAAAFGANAALTDEPMHPWHGSLAMFDIIGTLRFSGSLSDAQLHAALDGAPGVPAGPLRKQLKQCYSPYDGIFGVLNVGCLRQPTDADERAAIARTWRAVITAHPAAYLLHRWRELTALLRVFSSESPSWVAPMWIGYNDTTLPADQATAGPVQASLQDAMLSLGSGWLFRPIAYLALLLLLSPWWYRTRLTCALALSAMLSEALLFIAVPTPDFRYSIWLVFSTSLLLVLFVHACIATRRARRASTPARAAPAS